MFYYKRACPDFVQKDIRLCDIFIQKYHAMFRLIQYFFQKFSFIQTQPKSNQIIVIKHDIIIVIKYNAHNIIFADPVEKHTDKHFLTKKS